MKQQAIEAFNFIRTYTEVVPSIGLILGSGLGGLAKEVEHPTKIAYESIPHFPISTVSGHGGQFIIGKLFGAHVAMMQGRFHFYEGYSLQDVVFPIKVMKLLGVKTLFVTNAAGGINQTFSPGDLMLITDHIQFIYDKTCSSITKDHFINSCSIYSDKLLNQAEKVANNIGIPVKKGIYAAMSGPSYETPAEIRMLERLGADAVGMSTAPEATFANANNIEVIGISCISNMAAGILDEPLSHEDVINTTTKVKTRFRTYIKEMIKEIARKDV